jgi:hypothetical protein
MKHTKFWASNSPKPETPGTMPQRVGVGYRSKAAAYCLAASRGSVGSIDKHKKWDAVLLVLLDENLEATAIYEAPRAKVLRALRKPGSRARNERGALAVSKFKAIAELRWPVKIRSATLKTLFCGAVVCFVRFGALKNRIVNPPRIPAKTVYRSATRAVSKRSTSYPLPSLTPSPALPRIPLGAVES